MAKLKKVKKIYIKLAEPAKTSDTILIIVGIGTVLGTELPGKGTIYLQQQVKFVAPVHFGDTITATVEVVEKNVEKNRVKLKTTCTNQDGQVVVDGEALAMPPKES